jgi:peptidoglycan hydrolase-like protein with peptidoglycan-binding domain
MDRIGKLAYVMLLVLIGLVLIPPAPVSAFTFSKNRQLWQTGTDVQLLQHYLNTHGFAVAITGAGSRGNETALFGPQTYRALTKFQAAHGLPVSGFFGPLTRAAIETAAPGATAPTRTAPKADYSPPSTLSATSSPLIPNPITPPNFYYSPGFGGGGSDTTAPIITGTPTNVIAEATSPTGAIVTYSSPTATDNVDGAVAALCSLASGSSFVLGNTVVTCTATDVHNNIAHTNFVVTVQDTTAPAVSLTTPANSATVSGPLVTLSATASDNVGVVGVQFAVDGANVGSEVTSSPYLISWDSISATIGSHSITAVARDPAGNRATSTAVTVTVSNTGSVAIIPLGDSRTAIIDFDAAHLNGSNLSPFFWANAEHSQAFRLVGNFGISADTTKDMQARIATALPSKLSGYTNFMTIWGGVNDIGTLADTGPSSDGYFQTIADRITSIASSAMAAGIHPIIFTENGSEAFTSAQVTSTLNLNAALRSWVTANKGSNYAPILFDVAPIIWSGTPVSSIAFNSNYAYDGLHLQILGSDVTGAALYSLITQYVTPTPDTPSGTELLQNTTYATATGGSAGTGVTGTVPASWKTVRDNANVNSITFSLNESKARFTASSNASNTLNGFRLRQDPSISGLAGGNVLEGWGTVDILSGAVNLGDCSLNVSVNYSDSTFDLAYDGRATSNKGAISSVSNRTFLLRSPRVTINPAKTLSSINYFFNCRLGASGSTTVDFYNATLRKL